MDLVPKEIRVAADEATRAARQAQIALASVQEILATNAPQIERLLTDLSAVVADLRIVADRLAAPFK